MLLPTAKNILTSWLIALSVCCQCLLIPVAVAVADDITNKRGDLGRINDPVQDAKQAHRNGIKEFVGIELETEILLVGLSPSQQEHVRAHYRIRPINQRWESFSNVEDDPKRFYKLKRYANRYNLMMMKLIEQDQPKKRQYRY